MQFATVDYVILAATLVAAVFGLFGGFSGALAFLGLYLFVAIPLPGTGAWTGSLVAAVFGMKKWRALFAVFLGVLTAGVIMTLASYGVVSAFKIFAK